MSNPAETYEREMVPALFAPWASRLLDLAALRPGHDVLDLACGTGIVARGAASRVGAHGSVIGVDLNPQMLAVAAAAATRDGLEIAWREARMEALPFEDARFDRVLCQHGLQFSPEPTTAVAEMRRVLRPGGGVAIAVWQGLERHPLFARFNDALLRRLGVPALAAPFVMGDAGALQALLAGAGLHEVEVESATLPAIFPDPQGFVAMEVDVIAAAIPSAQHLDAQARAELAAAIESELRPTIDAAVHDGRLVVPMHALLARAVR